MASKKIILLLAAFVIGLGTIFAVQNAAKKQPGSPEEAAQAVPLTEVAIAARDLPTGTILKESDLKWTQWAATADTSAMIVKGQAKLADFTGAVVRDGFRSGDPIMTTRVAHAKDQGFLAAVLTPGMRAMSIALSPTAQVAGFIFPGDRVDVILTHSFSRRDVAELTERRISETILENVRVLALDQRSDNQLNDPKVAQLATLEVSQKDAEKLALAVDMSSGPTGSRASLILVLRSLALDETAEQTAKSQRSDPTWDSDVSRSYPTMSGDDGLLHRVQVMRGKTTTESTFERSR